MTKSIRYGWVALALMIVFLTLAAHAQTFTVLHSFTGGSDGGHPGAGMNVDQHGAFYGTTQYGGDLNCDNGGVAGCGVLFKFRNSGSGWILTPLHSFHDGPDPTYPGEPTIGPNGTLYGMTFLGGTDSNGLIYNAGPLPSAPVTGIAFWSYNPIYQFTGGDDGGSPTRLAPLLFDAAGNIYGAATYGGSTNSGVVYELTPSRSGWTETTLYSFTGGSDGSHLRGIIFDGEGNIYGIAAYGGNQNCGTVYKLTHSQSGWTESTVHSFQSNVDGCWPGPLILDKAGNLYGLTEQNGPDNNGGTVWELSPSNGSWTFSVLYAFPAATVGDFGPYAPALDAAGNLYGISNWGGYENLGFLFKLAPSNGGWTYTELYDFGTAPGQLDGCVPQGAPVLDADGNIYGVTEFCGRNDAGTVWEFTP